MYHTKRCHIPEACDINTNSHYGTKYQLVFIFMAQQPLVGQGLLSIEGFTITPRYIPPGRTPLDE
jgi:hypothetical protein